jgi:Flp pilus assembly pilin Flp
LRDERGASSIEYALLAGSIAVVIVVTVASIGQAVSAFFAGAASIFR